MNTTAAALQAHVTVATIRTWCRRGIIAATKQAGRWIIDTASLARRLTIGALKRPSRKVNMLDLTATYTVTLPGDAAPTVITPKVRTRERNGVELTTIRGLAPLLADQIDAIDDDGDRAHTLTVLAGAIITIRSEPDQSAAASTYGYTTFRDFGRLATTYTGTPDLPVDVVLDLGEQLRTQLTKGA
uniref:helix-turn-helix domain-containing protein n=1 Tax=Streptomyces tubercidicus TaxID=47759 RepID=UPI0037DD71F6|nr:helix-turn-helix domain-containing protein [Streptomyces tubercidicus]